MCVASCASHTAQLKYETVVIMSPDTDVAVMACDLLAVESFGTWSIYSLEILKSIARKTSLFHTLTISKAVVITYMNNYK